MLFNEKDNIPIIFLTLILEYYSIVYNYYNI